ncbi:MAG: 5-methylcytosine restriction system specificity protein McrC [Kurthia gibsonii]
MNNVKVEIYGKNNEKISDINNNAIKDTSFVIKSDEVSEYIKKCILNNNITITKNFLTQMDKKGIVNTAIGISKKREEHSLWNPNYKGNAYFGAVVGVIEDVFVMNLYDEEYVETEEMVHLYNVKQIKIEIRLQIRSRFDIEKPYFLATLLLRNKIKLTDNMVSSNEDDLYDYMLLFWYKTKLQEAYEKGFYKTYRRFEANGESLRGSIDISRHIKLNICQNNGKMAFSYRENTVNNYLNHLIIVAYEYLKKKYPELIEQNFDNDLDFKSIVEEIRHATGSNLIESSTFIKENNKPISHPYFMEYEDLRIICLKILRDEGISVWDSEVEKTKSILFYIPDLWELYLEDKLREHKRICNDLYVQGRVPGTNEAIKVFGKLDAQTNSEFVKEIYPDFLFFDDETPYFILDAKFRKGWESSIAIENKGEETQRKHSKIYDLGDYDKCIRDMSSINSNATGIIFPTNKLPNGMNSYFDDSTLCHKISQYNQQDIFYTFPIVVPPISVPLEKESDVMVNLKYSEWKKIFDEYLSRAIMKINEKIELEKSYSKRLREFIQKNPLPKREG